MKRNLQADLRYYEHLKLWTTRITWTDEDGLLDSKIEDHYTLKDAMNHIEKEIGDVSNNTSTS